MNFADRSNLWFKVGSLIDININSIEEKNIIDQISK